ncbi:MAG: hypothetical protein SNG10_00385, partial [Rikenellaceae bacterium]
MKRLITTLTLVAVAFSGQAQLKESIGKSDFSDWTRVKSVKDGVATVSSGDEISYTYPESENYGKGFRHYYNGCDWSRYRGVAFEVYLESESTTTVDLVFRVAQENAEHLEPMSKASVSVYSQGWNKVFVPWDLFSLREGQLGTLQGVHNFSIVATSEGNKKMQLRGVELVKAEKIALESPIQGKAAEAGGQVEYELQVGNVSNKSQAVQLHLPQKGWESMTTTITPSSVTLAAGETKMVKVAVSLPGSLPQGANEVQTIQVIANGEGAAMESIEFTTSVKVASPFIIHTPEGWAEVKEKAQKYDWAKAGYDKYDREAKSWKVPALPTKLPDMNPQLGRYLFHSTQGDNLMDCAIAYRLTGKKEYAQKCLDMIR